MKLAFDPPPPTPSLLSWHSRFAQLGEKFCTPQHPTALSAPYWVAYSEDTANLLQLPLHDRRSDAWLQAFSGNAPVPHNATPQTPSASVYSGHQFGVWAGQLGDGRALLLGELQGQEIQLKGAGPTPFSRMGDGRAVLRSSIREFLCSEAMHALGIPTTRALCVTGSDSPVYRETTETAAVLTRTAPSFIRFGHFEHFSHTGQYAELQTLADFVIEHFYPACRNTPPSSENNTAIHNPYAALLAGVTERTAHLIAHWQSVGFCHGVMNTDNMSILGLTIDYGPFQFLDGYDPRHICNHSDHQGRYAFYNQANMAYWNLFCLGQALLPLIDVKDQAIAAIETFKIHYPKALQQRFAAKLGFTDTSKVPTTLIEHLLKLLARDRVDYTIFWRTLSHWTRTCDLQNHAVHTLFHDTAAIDAWLHSYRDQLQNLPSQDLVHTSQRMLRTNPQYVLRNYLGELAIRAAHAKDFSVVAQLLHILQHPFDEHPSATPWAAPPPDWAKNIEISCSS